MKRGDDVSGNIFIYCLFQISNICLSVLGFFTFGISIYLVVLSKSLNFINLIFFFLGAILIVLAYYGCKMRNNPIGNWIYSVILTVIFLLDMVMTMMMFFYSGTVDTLMSSYEVSEETKEDIKKFISKNIRIVNDLLLIIVLILVSLLIFD
jgi:hypothetical protein